MVAGKNIVITGCLQGIRRETLKVFAENGANVFAHARVDNMEHHDFCQKVSEHAGV